MSSSTPPSRTAPPSGGGAGGLGSGSVNDRSVSLTPLSPAAPSSSTATASANLAARPSCLMPEAFTGGGDFEDYSQQFTTAAKLSGWQTATTDK